MMRGKQTGTRRRRRLLLLARDFRGKQQRACVDGGKAPGISKSKKTDLPNVQLHPPNCRQPRTVAKWRGILRVPHRSQQPGRLRVWLECQPVCLASGLPKRGRKTTRPNRAAAI